MAETNILDQATSSFPPVPPDTVLRPLPKPVLIPRLNPGAPNPFARAWSPELDKQAITAEDFVAFIDHLNIVNAPHAAIQVVDLASLAVGFVPSGAAAGVSGALSVVSKLATAAVNYNGTRKYFESMNENYFHPRKLHVKIIDYKHVLNMFSLEKKDPLVAPLSEETLDLGVQERCLRYLSRWSCELSFDVPAPSQQTTTLARMAARQVERKTTAADESAKKSREKAWKKHNEGKRLKEGRKERLRAKHLDWILVQNFDEWIASKTEKSDKKDKKKDKKEKKDKKDKDHD